MSIVPEDRVIQWSPGVAGGIPDIPVVSNVKDYGVVADGKTDDAPIINKAITEAKTPGALLIPAGTYLLKSRLILKSGLVLRGEGPDKTHLIFNGPDSRREAITIKAPGAWSKKKDYEIESGLARGSRRLTLAAIKGIEKGQTVWIFSENDPEKMYTRPRWKVGWAENSMGQVAQITAVDQHTIEIDVPLRLTYRKSLRPRLVVIEPITNAGLENLHLKRLDQSEHHLVYVVEALNCWVRNCELEFCMRAHVWISRSRFVTIENNYFHHAWDYRGGHGYGVVAAACTSDSLVTNNIFQSLRHSMMTKQGANGNVFSYNYSFDNVRTCDISIHGHYSYMNLFEGNVVQYVRYADSWGPTGPLTTCFRNRVGSNRLFIVGDHSHRANVIGNTLLQGEIKIEESVRDSFVEGNLIKGRMVWDTKSEKDTIPASLYLTGPPPFWGKRPWPCIGADVDGKNAEKLITIPAQDRYEQIASRTKLDAGLKNGQEKKIFPAAADGTTGDWELVYQANLKDARIGQDWKVVAGTWNVTEEGLVKTVRGQEGIIMLQKPLTPGAYRIEYTCISNDPGDLSLILGTRDGWSRDALFFGVGSYDNAASKIHVPDVPTQTVKTPGLIEKGRVHHVTVVRQAGSVSLAVDGKVIVQNRDTPLGLLGRHVSFYVFNEGAIKTLKLFHRPDPFLRKHLANYNPSEGDISRVPLTRIVPALRMGQAESPALLARILTQRMKQLGYKYVENPSFPALPKIENTWKTFYETNLKDIEIGKDWKVVAGAWTVTSEGLTKKWREGGDTILMLEKPLPAASSYLIEYTCTSNRPGDLSLMFKPDGKSASDLFVGFGSKDNTMTEISVRGGKRKNTIQGLIEKGRSRRVTVLARAMKIHVAVDGKTVLKSDLPLDIEGQHIALYIWRRGTFKSLKVFYK